MHRCVAAVLGLLLTSCASAPRPDYSGDPKFRNAYLTCHQQMMAAGGFGTGATPNRQQYFMCMKAKGYDV
jgi:hypothetical protein